MFWFIEILKVCTTIFKFSFLAFFVNFGSFFKGPADAHTSRLTDFVRHCQLSYRPGTRYNPQEQEFKGPNPSTAVCQFWMWSFKLIIGRKCYKFAGNCQFY